jgi:2-polyprenyl-3-methyl-5-hydroxy-6-metoxy-1,4-benzoquinol methylase
MTSLKDSKPYFSQTRFPKLWTIFQYLIGCTIDKRELCKIHYNDEKNILEIGCSTGNIAHTFKKYKDISYTGIDIDEAVIKYAQNIYKNNANFEFIHIDIRDYKNKVSKKFDYILFGAIIHHIDDDLSKELLNTAIGLLNPGGSIVIVEPLMPEKNDPWLVKYFIKLEQGKYVRTESNMIYLVKSINNLNLDNTTVKYINATPFKFPICAKFGVYKLRKTP